MESIYRDTKHTPDSKQTEPSHPAKMKRTHDPRHKPRAKEKRRNILKYSERQRMSNDFDSLLVIQMCLYI